MNSTEEKRTVYLANGKSKFEDKIICFSLCLSDLHEKTKDHSFEYEGKFYVKLEMHKKKEIDQYKNSHFLKVNTYKPPSK